MARRWLNDGKPDESGRLCLEIDPEDGTHPMRIWGQTKDEILDKATRTVEHGQHMIARLKAQTVSPASGGSSKPNGHGPAEPTAAATKPPLSEAERAQLTVDLSNPDKAPAAVTKLVESETGIDFSGIKNQETVRRIAAIQTAWSVNRPDFPKNPVNYKLMNDTAALRVGYQNITADVLDQVFEELSNAGMLLPEIDSASAPTVQPAETPANRTVRPRGAASYRRASIASPAPVAASQPKYTRAQIDALPSAEYRRKLEEDPEFRQAVAVLYASSSPPAQA